MQRLSVVLLLVCLGVSQAGTGVYKNGEVPATPVALTPTDFDEAIADPANTFWLLKFFAYVVYYCLFTHTP